MENFKQFFSKFFSEKGCNVDDFVDQIPKQHKSLEIEYLSRLIPYIEELTSAKELDGRRLCQILIESRIIEGKEAEDLEYIIHLKRGWYIYIEGNNFIIHNDVFALTSILIVLFYLPYSMFDVDSLFPDPIQRINMKIPTQSSVLNLSVSESKEITFYDPYPPLGKRTKIFHLDHEHGIENLISFCCDKDQNEFIRVVYIPLLKFTMNKI